MKDVEQADLVNELENQIPIDIWQVLVDLVRFLFPKKISSSLWMQLRMLALHTLLLQKTLESKWKFQVFFVIFLLIWWKSRKQNLQIIKLIVPHTNLNYHLETSVKKSWQLSKCINLIYILFHKICIKGVWNFNNKTYLIRIRFTSIFFFVSLFIRL